MFALIRVLKAKVRIWWFYRHRYCYICLRHNRSVRGQEELQRNEVRVWPCHAHAGLASYELRNCHSTGPDAGYITYDKHHTPTYHNYPKDLVP